MNTLILASFIALIFFLVLSYFHYSKVRATESFEINTQNKDSQKGFSWYEEEILSIMASFRHQLVINQTDLKVWQPWGRWRATGSEFRMERTPYSITISGSRGMVKIVLSQLDLEKIFL